ncbi:Aromatic prenyltransferase, DMATS type [Metarhizium album ARSEF 1941]|uniref:Aromatic prenyltransferase, DMATS type n=1 Tax=Metarhizium album (strain ARSEF 1941) TaxID=1081103 RepID=A0A0B2WN49_METAS|nr:Aromatic prenyltransferase, DMATS type [Metarhizium album ARSEF 1941]KHN97491.1 Aromatic prenyltransferase, DMATS type [Metarhizium album ARSEF 1941]
MELDEKPSTSVYDTLSLIFDFPNDDQKLWWHSTAPMFEAILQTAGHGINAQYRHLGIYKKHVIPFLGVYPRNDKKRWLSILTRYGIPFELSLNCSNSVVRYTYEPINAASGTRGDPYNTLAIWESLQKLVQIQAGVDLEWLKYFKRELTLDVLESAFLLDNGLARDGIKTQNKLALDLKGNQFALKVYIYPALKSLATGKSMHELIFGSVHKLSLQYSSIRAAFERLEGYVVSRNSRGGTGEGGVLQPRLLSCDLIDAAKSRIKIYLLERMVSLSAMEDLWTLGGQLADQSTMDGLALIRELWQLLRISPGLRSYPKPYLPLGQMPDEQLPSMVNYTLHHDDPTPEPQVYFTVFGMRDVDVTDALTAFFERRGWTEMARKYKAFLHRSL